MVRSHSRAQKNCMSRDPEIIYENPDFLVLNKPSGLQVHPARINEHKQKIRADGKARLSVKHKIAQGESQPTLTDWLLTHYPEVKTVGDDPAVRPGIVHRLDKETSGIMIVPRNQKTFEYLKALFQEHKVQKTYRALVVGTMEKKEGVIDAPIGIKNGTLKRSVHAKKMVKPAVTEYTTIEEMRISESVVGKSKGKTSALEASLDRIPKNEKNSSETYSLLEVKPKTGRTHQIRVHFASIGHPIVGDKLYGKKRQPAFAHRLMLHAQSLAFSDNRGNHFEFDAEPLDIHRMIS